MPLSMQELQKASSKFQATMYAMQVSGEAASTTDPLVSPDPIVSQHQQIEPETCYVAMGLNDQSAIADAKASASRSQHHGLALPPDRFSMTDQVLIQLAL
jgi:hypothetical protein